MKKSTAADPDLQIRKGGPGHPDPEIGGSRFPKIFFWPLGPQIGLKIMGGGGRGPGGGAPPRPAPRPPVPRPLPQIRHWNIRLDGYRKLSLISPGLKHLRRGF